MQILTNFSQNMDLANNLEIGINKLGIEDSNELEDVGNKWDFPLKELYKLAVEFYKGIAMQLMTFSRFFRTTYNIL